MKAIVHEGKEGFEGLNHQEVETGEPGKHDVQIRIKAAGMNRRDLMVPFRHKTDQPPLILGSDGAGIIEHVGEHVTQVKPGDEVIINPGLGWEHNSSAPPEGFEIVGLPGHGTFAEVVTMPAKNVEPKPPHLSWEEAGVLSLAGLTAYRVLFTRAKIKAGQTVMLPGIGSGVMVFALKFAKLAGARVIVTSRSKEKQEQALKLGADVAIDTASDWSRELQHETIDTLVESIGGATFDKSLGVIRKGGTVVTFGATTEDEVNINIRKFFYGQYNLLGSTMGCAEEYREMLRLVNQHRIRPELDETFVFADVHKAFEYQQESKNFGKIALLPIG
ncbi:zinc-binding dehydrogenase [Thalassobacillus sp. CUG 92003]|uniref:zinc-binding dehydrogenase n=1 Tax=Thalassobacillus sp. CUG 92003 TaxID=2736641 RepID=UPI0015E76A39|nr:zinc-binding dehydrogenase [Thalassobacillus sp. CUG 92003]